MRIEDSKAIQIGVYRVRPACEGDVVAVQRLDAGIYGDKMVLPTETIQGWLSINPDGFLVAADRSGKVVGYGMSIRRNPAGVVDRWDQDTGGGTCSAHEPDGQVLYGVSLASGSIGAGAAICLASRISAERSDGVRQVWIYARLRGFRQWSIDNNEPPGASIEQQLQEYVQARVDDVQMFYERCGMSLRRGVCDYLPADDQSLSCAAHMVWQRPSFI